MSSGSGFVAAGTAAALLLGAACLIHRARGLRLAPGTAPSATPTKQGFSAARIPRDLDAVVVGSGIGGLSTAAILAKQGQRVLVLEQHDVAGGNLHTFTEGGYEFDTGLHYVGGKVGEEGASTRKLLDYVTDGGVEWARMDDDYDIARSGDEEYRFCAGWTGLKKCLKASFPEEAGAIDRYFELVHDTTERAFPLLLFLRMLPRPLFRAGRWLFRRRLAVLDKTTKEVLATITRNAKLAGVLAYHYGDYGETPARGAFLANCLIAGHYRGGAYYPVGGPARIAEAICRLIEKRGGRVLVRARVEAILVDGNDRACGVVANGKRIPARKVVSGVGAPATFTKLLPESHRHLVGSCIDAMEDPEIKSDISLMSMFVGIKDEEGTLELPKSNYWVHSTWDHDGNIAACRLSPSLVPALFISFPSAKDPTYAVRRPGKHVACVIGPCIYGAVEKFKDARVRHRGEEYAAMKAEWQETFLKELLRQFPRLEGRIDFVDFGTAVTNDFYLGTHRGAVYGLAHTPRRFAQDWLRPRTPVEGLYLTGQDLCSCGVAGALVGGYLCAYAVAPASLFRTLSLWT